MKTVDLIYRLYHTVSRNKSNVWVTWFLPDCSLLGVTRCRGDRRNYGCKEVLQSSVPSASIHYICSQIWNHFVDWHLFLAQGLLDTALHFSLKFVPWQQWKCSRCIVVTEVHSELPIDLDHLYVLTSASTTHCISVADRASWHLHTGNYCPLS